MMDELPPYPIYIVKNLKGFAYWQNNKLKKFSNYIMQSILPNSKSSFHFAVFSGIIN